MALGMLVAIRFTTPHGTMPLYSLRVHLVQLAQHSPRTTTHLLTQPKVTFGPQQVEQPLLVLVQRQLSFVVTPMRLMVLMVCFKVMLTVTGLLMQTTLTCLP